MHSYMYVCMYVIILHEQDATQGQSFKRILIGLN